MAINLETKVLAGAKPEAMAQNELTPIQEDELVTYTASYKEKLRKLPEVEQMTSEIYVDDLNTILQFGQKATEGISKVSDNLLASMKAVKSEEAGEMIVQLTKVMDKFDIKELQDIKEPSALKKLFNRAKNSIEELFNKYETMGTEVDKIYIILKKYEDQINVANQNLALMYESNLEYYQLLEKYIVAGEMAMEELTGKLIPQYEAEALSGDPMVTATLQSLQQAQEMLGQRIYDLQIAENIALQTIPMIQGIQYSNFNLSRKINSAFIITLPIFKQCLTQAVMLKRQELQAKSMEALDQKTNELLLRNAENMANQNARIARMATGSSVQIETLEKTWQTIMKGIEQTKAIEEENRNARQNNAVKLENMKQSILKTTGHKPR